jgi:hypothetical protein
VIQSRRRVYDFPRAAGTLNLADLDQRDTAFDDTEDVAKLVLAIDRVRPVAGNRDRQLSGNSAPRV